jgi:hypothetical protein
MSEYMQPGQGRPAPPRRGGNLVIGLVLGLLFGGAAVGVAWAITASSGSGADPDPRADAEAVCGVIERTKVPQNAGSMKDLSLEDIRRWGVAEVGPSLAEQDPELKPLAEAMEKVLPAIQRFDVEQAKAAIDRVKQRCADL